MKAPTLGRSARLIFVGALAICLGAGARAEDFLAISSKVSNGYVRTALPDETPEPETYTFKDGGFLSSRMADDSIDKMAFASVARDIGASLAARKYFPAADPRAAKLLIVVYWGTSRAQGEFSSHTVVGEKETSESPVIDSHPRGYVPFWQGATAGEAQAFGDKMVTEEDAMMLGYDSASDPDLREYRYFVVLLAYDMQAFLRDKKEMLLWQTRFSIGERRNHFDLQLKAMALGASAYFGRDSLGLRHGSLPEGHVEIGEAKLVDVRPDLGAAAVLAPDGAHVAYLKRRGDGLELAVVDLARREVHLAGPLPGIAGQHLQLAWADGGRVLVRLPSSEILAFNDRGKRVDLDPRNALPVFEGSVADKGLSEIQATADGKFPHRRVTVLGPDRDGKRYLLLVTDPSGAGRYFVYDQLNELLYDIGRNLPVK